MSKHKRQLTLSWSVLRPACPWGAIESCLHQAVSGRNWPCQWRFVWCFPRKRWEPRIHVISAMLRIPPSKTTCIFCQIKWHSFAIDLWPPQERIVRQAKFAENIHKVSSAEYSQPGKLLEDWRRHNKCFKFLQTNLLWKQLQAASGKQFTSQVSSLRTSSCPFHIALWLWPPMSMTWKSAVKGVAESPDLTQWSRTFMARSTAGFCWNRNDSTNFRYVMLCLPSTPVCSMQYTY